MTAMKTFLRSNYLVVMLLVATASMQGALLYRHFKPAPTGPKAIRDAPKGTVIDVASMPSLGSAKTSVVLVEFTDFECPFCRTYASTVFQNLRSEFVDTGKIRYAFANNPLSNIHPQAILLASAAICAGRQKQYSAMHDALFQQQPRTLDAVLGLSKQLDMQPQPFQTCLDEGDTQRRLKQDQAVARTLELMGTPAFAIGVMQKNGQLLVKTLIAGAQPIDAFRTALDEVL